jgi:hypothetical protein
MFADIVTIVAAGFTMALIIAVFIWFEAFLYKFRTGRSFFTDIEEVSAPVWTRFPLVAPILLAALTAHAAVNHHLALALASGVILGIALIYLAFWVRQDIGKGHPLDR